MCRNLNPIRCNSAGRNGREENRKRARALARGDQRSAAIISDRDIKRRSRASRALKLSRLCLYYTTRGALEIRDGAINTEH